MVRGAERSDLSLIHHDSEASYSSFPSGCKRLRNEERRSIYETLLKESKDGKLRRGSVKSTATLYQVSTRTIQSIWERATSSLEGQPYVDVSHRYSRSGRKRKYVEFTKILDVPLRRRTNIRSLANALDISKSTIHRGIKEGKIRPNSNAIKPRLTDENKRSRVQFCLSMLETPCPCKQPTFKAMLDVVHLDEKWFYMSKESQKYYLHPFEAETHRPCQSKLFIAKVMFLVAIARPRFDPLRNEEFSGKIGIFPFVFKEPTKRRSKNRQAGIFETKAMTSITKDVYRRCLIDKVLPAIREKWPRSDGIQKIYIQQDNAKPHIDPMDDEFHHASTIGDFEMHLTFQPSNSPDMNVLDLGVFNSIQSLQHQKAPKTIDDLVLAVEESFNEMSTETINNVFLTLQACMIEVLRHNGGFDYKVPHLGKGILKNAGKLPFQLECKTEIVESASMQLESNEVSCWSEVSRWIICKDTVCLKHYNTTDRDGVQ
ncbi:hypothetical protein OROGR_026060 [Orobanche gracilis]